MPRAALRSQRQFSHTQPQTQTQNPTQTQRYSRSQRRVEDEDEEEEIPLDDDDEPGANETGTDLKKRATDLVRLALFQEQRRMPLRRDEISKKVMGSQRSAFKAVFYEAQSILRNTFGMELVELPTRAATHDATAGQDRGQDKAGTQNGENAGERQKVTGLKKKAVSQGSKTYILRSTLDPALIERAALTNKRIFEVEAADAPDDVADAEPGTRTYGSLIAWNSADQLAALGILYVILALVLVSGKVISDMDLRLLLRRLRLRPPTQIALPAHTPHRTLTFDAYLTQLQRQGYLDRTRIGAGGAAQKRRRGGVGATQAGGGGGEENDAVWEWRWGPRAAAEIGEAAVARFVAEFMAERARRGGAGGGGGPGSGAGGGAGSDEGSDEEVGGRRARAHREEAQKRLAALLKGVELAAGGDLADATV
ncbi:MAGE-domain-containing protein [Lactarius hengduanensis]|nr:MAGE-domain-containing protein [Lactarius hengduanensis]